MDRRAYLVTGATGAALSAALIGAWTASPRLLGAPPPPTTDTQTPFHQRPVPTIKSGGSDEGMPTWFKVTMTVLLGLYVLGLLLLVAFARWRRWRAERLEDVPDPEEQVEPDWTPTAVARLRATAEEQLAALRTGTARNAIVACWLRLQEATAAAGLLASPAETSTEYAVRGMQRLGLEPTAIADLAALYREARFSRHPLTEDHRESALAALHLLLADLPVRPVTVGAGGRA